MYRLLSYFVKCAQMAHKGSDIPLDEIHIVPLIGLNYDVKVLVGATLHVGFADPATGGFIRLVQIGWWIMSAKNGLCFCWQPIMQADLYSEAEKEPAIAV